MATRVIFQDPIYQYPNRYRLTDIGGGLYEIESEPGTVTQKGTLLSSGNLNATAEEVIFHTVDTGTNANEFITSINNLSDYFNGLRIILKSNTINTGSCTINISSLGNKNIKKINTSGNKINLQANDIIKNKYELLIYDGTDFILSNPAADLAAVITDLNNLTIKVNTIESDVNTIKNKVVHFAVSSGINNAYTVNVSGVTSLYAGLQINVVASFSNTGSSTLQINSLESKTIKLNQNNLIGNEIKINNIFTVIFDGVNWQLQPTMSQMQQRKTYSELKTLKDNNQLIPGTQYVLTDYRTKYIQPDTNVIKEMSVEELVLTANSVNTFEPIVSSATYPQDTIWYDFNNNVCEDKTTPRNGFITRRYDSISGNNCPQDWRTMLWARWKPDANQYYKNNTLTNYSVWTSGAAVMGVIYKAGNKLLIAKNTNVPSKIDDSNVFDIVYPDLEVGIIRVDKMKKFSGTTDTLELKKGELHERLTFGTNSNKNIIGECYQMLHNNVFGNDCFSNSFGSCCNNNSFGNSCYNNSFGNDCNSISFSNYCYSNSFGNNCNSNSFGNNCYYNSFDNECNSNSFGNSCSSISFGNYCHSNSLGNNSFANSFGNNNFTNKLGNECKSISFGNSCYNNSFGNNCYYNSFGNYCYSNKLGDMIYSNSFGNYCYDNSFGNNCNYNSFDNACYSNSFGKNCNNLIVKALQSKNLTSLNIYLSTHTINIESNTDGKYVLWYLTSSNQPVYTVIP